jgi:hypothetical protein
MVSIALEYVLPIISVLMVVLYHLFFLYRFHYKPNLVTLALNIQIKRRWVEKMHNEPGIASVHTLRNVFTASSSHVKQKYKIYLFIKNLFYLKVAACAVISFFLFRKGFLFLYKKLILLFLFHKKKEK